MTRAAKWITGLGLTVVALAGLLVLVLSPLVLGKTIKIPPRISGGIFSERGAPKALTPADLATIREWLASHRSGWQPDFQTRPPPTATISLDEADHEAVFVLDLWFDANNPGRRDPKSLGWYGAVSVENPAGHPIGVQSFSAEEFAPLTEIASQ